MPKKIKVHLKEEFGRYLVLTSPKVSLTISDREGDMSPDGFEVDEELYERYLKPYVAKGAQKKTKKREEKSLEKELDLPDDGCASC